MPEAVRERNGRLPVERLVPEAVLTALQQRATTVDEITPSLVTELERRFRITEQYGVSKRRLRNHLQRVCSKGEHQSPSTLPTDRRGEAPTAGWRKKVRAYRRRQASVAAILDRTFGQSARCSPDLWERRAYLMLVGLVYERLATNEEEIPTDELVALAKVLAENRRVEARAKQNPQPDQPTEGITPPTGDLPENFADVVRQVYGTNLATSD